MLALMAVYGPSTGHWKSPVAVVSFMYVRRLDLVSSKEIPCRVTSFMYVRRLELVGSEDFLGR